ncbi:type IX secretion system protein PorQ [Flavobacterium sp. NKUCC04_CG]|uniref:type IX secretion system protein PorQ n=1 Tax=Flavobacterium sp. NKUCC04_CG TaxID=2842121 RepID=UPI001C5BE03B|nr:type IX secretion system protein PorQ [Flavobacterium sp. NKUCC04_CG]MBW3519630.1 type IX secretion system protein PorQ [Flavobacterium sp. NKUCC04_CG]
MRKHIFLFLFVAISFQVFGQVGGDYTYQFLNMTPSPRQAALGGKVITNWDSDVNQPFFNPASLNSKMDNQLSLNFGKYFGEVTYGTAAYAKTFDNRKNVHIGVNYVNYGDFEGYDENGIETGRFTGTEVALSVGYSYQIVSSDWYVGANVKLISSSLESYNSFGAAMDLGVLYVEEDSKWNFAFTVRNLGAQLSTYADHREKLPLDVLIGVSKELENVPIRWHVTLDNLQKWDLSYSNPSRSETNLEGEITEEKVGFFNNALRHVIIGAELFPDKKFNLRLGYNFRKGEELRIVDQRHFSGITAGFGFRFNRIRLDYSYSRHTVAANTSLFGLAVDLQ